MNKPCILFLTVLINNALGQNLRPNAQFLFPGQEQLDRQGQNPGRGQILGPFLFPGQNQLPGQNQFPREGQSSGQGQLPTQGTGSSSASTTQTPTVTDCIRDCPVTSEYNPVCGTNNVTYNNPGRLYCAQLCGVNVNLLRRSRCPTPAQ